MLEFALGFLCCTFLVIGYHLLLLRWGVSFLTPPVVRYEDEKPPEHMVFGGSKAVRPDVSKAMEASTDYYKAIMEEKLAKGGLDGKRHPYFS